MATKQYKPVRMTREAYEAFIKRKEKMENSIFMLNGKRESIPLTKVFEISAKLPIKMLDDELVYFAGTIKKGRKRA